ncbi:hypothetical protein Tco_0603578, partial [Tanacetum coccineum]
YEEEELWRSGDEKTDYEPPFVDVKAFETSNMEGKFKAMNRKGAKGFVLAGFPTLGVNHFEDPLDLIIVSG